MIPRERVFRGPRCRWTGVTGGPAKSSWPRAPEGTGRVSYILELLGRGVDSDLSDLLDRYFWWPSGDGEQPAAPAKAQHDGPGRRLQVGLAHLRAGRLDDAVRHLDDACRAKGDCLSARAALASACDEKGDPAGALEHLKVADEIRPSEAAVLFGIGFCLEKLLEPEQAAAYYRRAVAADGSFMTARERLAAIGVLTGELDEAIEQYQSLRDIEPREICYRSALAHLYLRSRRHDEAVDEFETAIALEPDNWALVDDDVEAMVAEGRIPEAVERLHWLISQQGPFADLHVRLGDLCSRVRDDDGAVRNYLLALELQPGYLEATVKLGTHHLVNGRWEEAAEAFHRAAELNDRLLTCYVGMGVAQSALGEGDAAGNSFDLAGAVEPNSTMLMAEVARLQLRSAASGGFPGGFPGGTQAPAGGPDLDGDDLLPLQIHRHAEEVHRHPRHADLRYRYGVLLRARRQDAAAMEQFNEAARLSPSYTKAWIKLGVVRQELHLVDEAADAFCRALDIEPRLVELHYRLALLYTNREKFENEVRRMEAEAGESERDRIRADLALSLQNMDLMDRVSATWRSLWKIHRARAG